MVRILIVEDEGNIRRMAKRILIGAGYDTVSSEGGRPAYGYLAMHSGEVDLVFTDENMPEGTGSELVRRIRAEDHTKDIPVIMASGLPGNRAGALEAGVNYFMDKPYTPQTLIKAVYDCLNP